MEKLRIIFKHEFIEKKAKNFINDFCCKIVAETQDTKDEKTIIYLSNMYKEDLVKFIYTKTNEIAGYYLFSDTHEFSIIFKVR